MASPLREATFVFAMVTLLGLEGCGGSKPSKQQLAQRCGQRVANSLSPGFGGSQRRALQQSAAQAAAEYYIQTGKCSADQK